MAPRLAARKIILFLYHVVALEDTIYMHCDPNHPMAACPSGYCCVYDEFDHSLVYCEQNGGLGDGCSVERSDNDCPCSTALVCKPNIETAVFVSMFGRCVN